MKRLLLAISITSVALSVTASPRPEFHERNHWLGRHEYNNVQIPQADVPDSTPTFALAMLGMAALSLAAIPRKFRKA